MRKEGESLWYPHLLRPRDYPRDFSSPPRLTIRSLSRDEPRDLNPQSSAYHNGRRWHGKRRIDFNPTCSHRVARERQSCWCRPASRE